MNCYVRYIGVIDNQDIVHHVEFRPGVNVVTGKSSTGKSAMIEIFDYCFGSSDFTVPEGVITDSAQLYFTVLAFPETHLVLARRGRADRAYIKEETDAAAVAEAGLLHMAYFEDADLIALDDFKKELGRYFGTTMTDVDEDPEVRRHRRRKSPTPSVRTFMSFMLQHQNLVANKHAIFYRFDEKEKREQAIEHLRIFLGYADQEYFLLSQQLNELRASLRAVELQMPHQEEVRKQAIDAINKALSGYAAIAGTCLVAASPEDLYATPARWLKELETSAVRIEGAVEEFSRQSAHLDSERSELLGRLRRLDRQISAIESSIRFAQEYAREAEAVTAPERVEVVVSECPFCHSPHNEMEREADRLRDAINWLNQELQRSPYLRESFEVDKRRLSAEAAHVRAKIREIDAQIATLDRQTTELEKRRPVSELAIKAKLRVEGILDGLVDKRSAIPLEDKKAALERQIALLKDKQARYGMDAKLREARAHIESTMKEVGGRLEFEESFRPVNLQFSLESFDLWHEADDQHRVFLRAMGSGANWLYCHLTLFMALHKLFCSRGNECRIPPIVFFDQPSQVYFPSLVIDRSDEFNARDLAEKAGKAHRVDEDLRAVQNLYSELVRFCEQTLRETGVEPQIIVTDHADNLELTDGVDFESLVRARWRDRGFIEPPSNK